MILILASTSTSRRAMLRAAGVPHEAVAPGVDEDEVRAALAGDGDVSPERVADSLAEHKALRISLRFPDALVLGADQVLARADGGMMEKPADLIEAAEQLRRLRGATHRLISAAVLAQGGVPVWRTYDVASLTMRAFGDTFLERYLSIAGADILDSTGGYHIEGLGAQLFASVDGDHFTVRGLPLFSVLAELRARGVLAV